MRKGYAFLCQTNEEKEELLSIAAKYGATNRLVNPPLYIIIEKQDCLNKIQSYWLSSTNHIDGKYLIKSTNDFELYCQILIYEGFYLKVNNQLEVDFINNIAKSHELSELTQSTNRSFPFYISIRNSPARSRGIFWSLEKISDCALIDLNQACSAFDVLFSKNKTVKINTYDIKIYEDKIDIFETVSGDEFSVSISDLNKIVELVKNKNHIIVNGSKYPVGISSVDIGCKSFLTKDILALDKYLKDNKNG